MKTIIFTDLDATLLEHDTYSFEKAAPALHKIREKGIPLIIVTSKTRKEVEQLIDQLNINEPFIVENGAAIFFPKGYRNFKFENAKEKGKYSVIELGKPYKEIRNFIKKYKKQFGLLGFGDLSVEEIAKLTNLSIEKARLAKEREYTEPFLIKDPSQIPELESIALKQGLKITQGGRFYHLIGKDQDKGKAVKLLKDIFEKNLKNKVKTIALGDSKNDIPMLKEVDIPVLIPKKDGSYENISLPNLIKSKKPASEGWNEVVLQLI